MKTPFVRYPANLLQLELQRRFTRLVYLSIVIISVMVGMLFIKPRWAWATNPIYNPGGAPTPTSETLINIFGCNDVNCSTTKYLMFRGGLWNGATTEYVDGYTCLQTVPVGGTYPLTSQAGYEYVYLPDNNYINFKKPSYANLACWNGSIWTNSILIGGNYPVSIAYGVIVYPLAGKSFEELVYSNATVKYTDDGSHDFDTQYNNLGVLNPGDILIVAGNPAWGLTATPNPASVNEPINIRASWQNIPFSPLSLYFSRDDFDPSLGVQPIVTYYPLGSSGSYTFQTSYSTYTVAGRPHNPHVWLYSDANGSGTSIDITGTGIIIVNQYYNKDSAAPSTFTVGDGSGATMNTPTTYEWNVDPNVCLPSTVSEVRLFKGYPPASPVIDSGSVVALSGSTVITLTETPLPYSEGLFPYIRVVCVDGSINSLWEGGSWYKAKAGFINVLGQTGAILTAPNEEGIFGVDPNSLRIQTPDGANLVIRASIALLNDTVQGIFNLANGAFSLIRQAPVYTWLSDLIAPEPGTVRIIPSSYLGYDLRTFIGADQYTITYIDPETALPFKMFFGLMFMTAIFYYVIELIF